MRIPNGPNRPNRADRPIGTGRLAATLLMLLFAAACRHDEAGAPAAAAPASVSIMTFNALNLFDNVDDPDHDDKAYLPIEAKQNRAHVDACNRIEVDRWRDECLYLDWSDAVVEHKLRTLAAVIRTVDGGRGPDIIAFQEIENAGILDRLSFDYLREANYGPAILIEGQDDRGIDVAFLSRLPLTERPILHPVAFPGHPDRAGDTRGILEATFMLPDGAELTGFAVHFPAPYHPPEMRQVAYRRLNELRAALPDDRAAFAAGDFNTTSEEMRRTGVVERLVAPYWTVAHEYCQGCPGTHYYAPDDSWSFLDMILFAPADAAGNRWRLDRDSVQLVTSHPQQLQSNGAPRRYDADARTGVSDHLPLLVSIRPAQPADQ